MNHLLMAIGHLVRDDRGQDLLEYGLLTVLIAVAAMLAVGTLGTTFNTKLWLPIVEIVQTF